MKVSLKWLSEYVELKFPAREIAHRLTMAGNEVGSMQIIGGQWQNVLVGQVLEVAKHPNADRLTLVTVDLGGERPTVVCGAPNVRPGLKVAFAKVGAGCHPQPPHQPGTQIGDDVTVEVGQHQDIKLVRTLYKLGAQVVYDPVFKLYVCIGTGDVSGDLEEETVSKFQNIGFVDGGYLFSPVSPRVLKGIADDAAATGLRYAFYCQT